jgi:hypothetical protein
MEKLWTILEKYDNQVGMESFCNSLSKIIQHVHSEQDVTNIIESIHKMEEDDAFQMDKVF